MTVKDVYDAIDSFAPFESQSEWDNAGILLGDPNREVTKAIVALDVTEYEIEAAKKAGAQLIISHHPAIFHPVKSVLACSVAYASISSGLSVISAHTNLDKAPGGVNDSLCEALGLTYSKVPSPAADGFLNICTVDGQMSTAEFAKLVSDRLSAAVSYSKGAETVHKIGVCSGAGAEFAEEARLLGCDAFLTGDASYHNFVNCVSLGISLFAAGHFETENIIVPALIKKLTEIFSEADFIPSERRSPIITVV